MIAGARSFDEIAATYSAVRPAYPEAAVDWILRPANRLEERCDGKHVGARVLDLGAGTGKLTRQLIDAGLDVVAVEPSPQMGAELSAYVPEAELLTGSAEEIPLPDSSVDSVVVGSAFHWFDHAAALAEIARVLRRGGRLGLIRNRPDDRHDWVARLDGIAGARARRGRQDPTPDEADAFDNAEEAQFPLAYEVTGQALGELVQTFSYYLRLDAEGRADLLTRVAELVRTHPDLAGRATFPLPYMTRCWRATRR